MGLIIISSACHLGLPTGRSGGSWLHFQRPEDGHFQHLSLLDMYGVHMCIPMYTLRIQMNEMPPGQSIYIHIDMCSYVGTIIRMHLQWPPAYNPSYTSQKIHKTHTHIYIYRTYTDVCIYIYVNILMCVHIYMIYMFTHIYIYTHIRIYIYMCKNIQCVNILMCIYI